MWKRLLAIVGIALVNSGALLAVFASAFGGVMGSGGAATRTERLLLAILGFPLVPRFGESVGPVALNSLLWGVALGSAIPAARRAYERRRTAA